VDTKLSISIDQSLYGDYWSSKTETVLGAIDAAKSTTMGVHKSLCTLDGFFGALTILPSPAEVRDNASCFFDGVVYAAFLLVLIYQEQRYGAKIANIRSLLLSRDVGRSKVDDAAKIVFPRNPEAGGRLVAAAEALLKQNIRAILKKDVTDRRRQIVLERLEALSRTMLAKPTAIIDGQLRTEKTQVEKPVVGGRKGQTTKVLRVSKVRPLVEQAGMPLRATEQALVKVVNEKLASLDRIIAMNVFQGGDTNLTLVVSRVRTALSYLYGLTDNANRLIHLRRRMIRDLVIAKRRAMGATDAALRAKVLSTEWADAQAVYLSGADDRSAFTAALAAVMSVDPTEENILGAKLSGLEAKLKTVMAAAGAEASDTVESSGLFL
jgi:hypothetical protein